MQNVSLFTDYSEIVSLPEFCEMLNICRSSGYKLLKSGEIGYMKMGSKILIPKRNIVEYVNAKMK